MNIIIAFIIGIFVGWITKIPWLRKWYKEFQDYKEAGEKLRKKLEGNTECK